MFEILFPVSLFFIKGRVLFYYISFYSDFLEYLKKKLIKLILLHFYICFYSGFYVEINYLNGYITVTVEIYIWYCWKKNNIYMNIQVTGIVSQILALGAYRNLWLHGAVLSLCMWNCCCRAGIEATQSEVILDAFSDKVMRSRTKLSERNNR